LKDLDYVDAVLTAHGGISNRELKAWAVSISSTSATRGISNRELKVHEYAVKLLSVGKVKGISNRELKETELLTRQNLPCWKIRHLK